MLKMETLILSRLIRIALMLALFSSLAQAQNGDEPGEEQPPLPSHIQVPPAPPLSPEEALKTFKLQSGFRIELVASEPMIESPVALSFDPDGRLWVVETPEYPGGREIRENDDRLSPWRTRAGSDRLQRAPGTGRPDALRRQDPALLPRYPRVDEHVSRGHVPLSCQARRLHCETGIDRTNNAVN
jgi:glucose/arabinose dehydrogenase